MHGTDVAESERGALEDESDRDGLDASVLDCVILLSTS